ncbi:MAG: hypothetical protein J6Y28_08300 [Acholeplasmatales bacterium]|nr:hypothetical protein [Acholeplasmatales bacterium]
MLKCNTEIMKDLKQIYEEKNEILQKESSECMVSYISEEDKILTDYNYSEVRQKIDDLNKKEIYLRGLLAKSNATTIVPEFNMTIGDCLVYLAQLNEVSKRLSVLSCKRKKTRTLQYLKQVEYTEILYDVDKAKEDYEKTKQEIVKLQMAIDRVNLTNLIEV